MYREVIRSPQYAARKRAASYQLNTLCSTWNTIDQDQKIYVNHHQNWQQQDNIQITNGQPPTFFQNQQSHVAQQHLSNHLIVQHRQHQQDHVQYPINKFHVLQQQQEHTQKPPKSQQDHHHHNYHHAKGVHFRTQSRNSLSHPNLTSLCGSQHQQQQEQHYQEVPLSIYNTQFQSQMDIKAGSRSRIPTIHHQRIRHHHSRAHSQPVYTQLHSRSSSNLPMMNIADGNPGGNVYNDLIYALPVKPFLSSQDVRVNGLSVKAPLIYRNEEIYSGSSINRYTQSIILLYLLHRASKLKRERERDQLVLFII